MKTNEIQTSLKGNRVAAETEMQNPVIQSTAK